MNCSKSYLKKYDNNESSNDSENEQTINIILSKKNNFCNETSGDNFVSFFDKVEELYLKLKFINTNKNEKITHLNNNKTIANNDDSDIFNNYNLYNLNTIDEIITKLNKKIICDGMIKRKNLIEYEF